MEKIGNRLLDKPVSSKPFQWIQNRRWQAALVQDVSVSVSGERAKPSKTVRGLTDRLDYQDTLNVGFIKLCFYKITWVFRTKVTFYTSNECAISWFRALKRVITTNAMTNYVCKNCRATAIWFLSWKEMKGQFCCSKSEQICRVINKLWEAIARAAGLS